MAALRRRTRGPSGRSRRASPCSAPVDPFERSSGSDRRRLRRVRHRPRSAGAGLGGGGGDGGRTSACDRRGSGVGGGAVPAGLPRSAARAAAGGRRERAGADARYPPRERDGAGPPQTRGAGAPPWGRCSTSSRSASPIIRSLQRPKGLDQKRVPPRRSRSAVRSLGWSCAPGGTSGRWSCIPGGEPIPRPPA